MKFVLKLLLIILGIPVFLLFVLSVNIRFQLLSPDFWIGTFRNANTYSQISQSLSIRFVSRVVAEGGKVSDVELLSGLISPESISGFTEENISNLLTYANGKAPQLIVYMPLSLQGIAKNADITSINDLSQRMTFDEFVREYSIQDISQSDIVVISRFGMWSWIAFATSAILFILIVYLIYLLVPGGKRLVAPGILLLICGLLVLGGYFVGKSTATQLTANYLLSADIGQSLMAIIFPPLIYNLVHLWVWFGGIGTFLGVLLFFIRKPAINKLK